MYFIRNFSIFFLLLASQTKANFNSNLIQKACTINKPNWDFDFCIKLLNSDIKISSTQTPFDLAIAIIQAGNSHASKTQDYINKKHSHEGGTSIVVSSALSVCSKWYVWLIFSICQIHLNFFSIVFLMCVMIIFVILISVTFEREALLALILVFWTMWLFYF